MHKIQPLSATVYV